jgi:hypothetical protein
MHVFDNQPSLPGSEVAVQIQIWAAVLVVFTLIDGAVFLPLPGVGIRVWLIWLIG